MIAWGDLVLEKLDEGLGGMEYSSRMRLDLGGRRAPRGGERGFGTRSRRLGSSRELPRGVRGNRAAYQTKIPHERDMLAVRRRNDSPP